jgi:hypothetical protein
MDTKMNEIKSNPITGVDLEGKVIVMKAGVLSKKYDTIGNRLHKATGGFGCNPTATGQAVFTKCLLDGEESRWERYDFEGWITEDEANVLLVKERVLA